MHSQFDHFWLKGDFNVHTSSFHSRLLTKVGHRPGCWVGFGLLLEEQGVSITNHGLRAQINCKFVCVRSRWWWSSRILLKRSKIAEVPPEGRLFRRQIYRTGIYVQICLAFFKALHVQLLSSWIKKTFFRFWLVQKNLISKPHFSSQYLFCSIFKIYEICARLHHSKVNICSLLELTQLDI